MSPPGDGTESITFTLTIVIAPVLTSPNDQAEFVGETPGPQAVTAPGATKLLTPARPFVLWGAAVDPSLAAGADGPHASPAAARGAVPDDPASRATPGQMSWTVSGSVGPAVANLLGLGLTAQPAGPSGQDRWVWEVSFRSRGTDDRADRPSGADRLVRATAGKEYRAAGALWPPRGSAPGNEANDATGPAPSASDAVRPLLARFAAEVPPDAPPPAPESDPAVRPVAWVKRFLWTGLVATAGLLKLYRIRLNITSFTLPDWGSDRQHGMGSAEPDC